MAQPKASRLKQILEQPGAKTRVGRAVASLIGVGIASIAVIGVLLCWHAVRRARLIRQSQPPPRNLSLPDLDPRENLRESRR